MENAVDALKMAFAVFVFIMAISIVMYMFTEAKTTSDLVLASSDVTGFMDYTEINNIENSGTVIGEDRIVGLETIIPTLYKYYKENYTVVFRNSNGTPLEIYETQTNEKLWSKNYTNKYYTSDTDLKKICSFDVDEETSRREPWTGNNEYYKQNIDMFLSGGEFKAPSGNGMDYNYSDININGWRRTHGFIDEYKDSKFRESLGVYTYNDIPEDDGQETSGVADVKPKKKRVIVYTLLP